MAWVPIDAFLVSQLAPVVACSAGHQYPSGLFRLFRFFTSVFIVIMTGVGLSLILVVWGVWINFVSRVYPPLRVPCPKRLSSICYEIWFRFVWDPGGKLGDLGFFVFRRPYLVASLIITETERVWRLKLWAADSFDLRLVFILFFIPCKLVEVILYCFNEFQLDYCPVSTTIECIGEQHNPFFWDEDSLHQFVVVLFFYFQEVSFNFVNEQPVRQLMVCSALGFHINLVRLIIAPAAVQDALINDCNRDYI
jgi:hypothetical protein